MKLIVEQAFERANKAEAANRKLTEDLGEVKKAIENIARYSQSTDYYQQQAGIALDILKRNGVE